MSNRLRELRLDQGKTLRELVDDLKVKTGLSISSDTLAKYEQGNREPKFERWQKLADYFDVPAPYLQGLGVSKWDVIDDLVNKLIYDSNSELSITLSFLLEENIEKANISEWLTASDDHRYFGTERYIERAIELKDNNLLFFLINTVLSFVNDYNFLLSLNKSDGKSYYEALQSKVDFELSNNLDSWQWIEFKTDTLKLPESDKRTLIDIFGSLFDKMEALQSRVRDLEKPDGPFDRDDFM